MLLTKRKKDSKLKKIRRQLYGNLICLCTVLLTPLTSAAAESNTAPIDTSPQAKFTVLISALVDEVQSQVPIYQERQQYVTSDKYTDSLGNAESISRFCASRWSDAYWWLQENYSANWPHGPVNEDRVPINLGYTIGIAVAANAMRESTCMPNTLQGGQPISPSLSAAEATDALLSFGSASGQAWGIIQWDGGRRYNFALFCQASGLDPRCLEVQLNYMAYEYYASNEYGSYDRLVSRYTNADSSLENVKDAAEVFRADVERGGAPHSSTAILENWSNKWNDAWGSQPAGGLYMYLVNKE